MQDSTEAVQVTLEDKILKLLSILRRTEIYLGRDDIVYKELEPAESLVNRLCDLVSQCQNVAERINDQVSMLGHAVEDDEQQD